MDEETARPSRRERQVAERLENILHSAARLFAAKGFHRTTTREIAEAADVAEGTLYNYFESKNDLLFGIMERLAQAQPAGEGFQSAAGADLRRLLAGLMHSRSRQLNNIMTMHQAILSEILADENLRQRYYQELVAPALEMIEKQLELRQALGQIRAVDTRLAAHTFGGLLYGLFLLQVLGDPVVQSDWDDLVETSIGVIIDGLANKPASAGKG